MKLLNNLSITRKCLVSTLISMLVVVGMSGFVIHDLLALQNATAAANKTVTVRAQTRSVTGDLATAQARLYRAINLKSQNVEVAIVRSARIDAVKAMDGARAKLAALRFDEIPID